MPWLAIIFGVLLAALLVGLAVYDFKHMILPNSLNAALAIGGLVQSIATQRPALVDAALGGLVAGGLLLAVSSAFRYARGFDGLGLGDVKLAAAGAVWTGVAGIGAILLVATATCAAVVLLRAANGRGVDRLARFPFGPYLALGVFAAWLAVQVN